MKCDECQELLVEYSLGELAPARATLVEAHLAGGCADCQQELRDVHESWGSMGRSLEEVVPPTAIKERLLARIEAERRGSAADVGGDRVVKATATPVARELRWRQIFAYAATLLLGFLIGALAVRQMEPSGPAGVDRDAQLAEILESAREQFGAPEIRFALLLAAADENEVVGHMMWDARGRSLHFFAFAVTPPTAGRQLAVWFVPADGKPIYAGNLDVSAAGAAAGVFESLELDGPVARVIVTDEPAGIVSSPSGPPRIVSQFD
jgi:anti-sigma-K factor RskA